MFLCFISVDISGVREGLYFLWYPLGMCRLVDFFIIDVRCCIALFNDFELVMVSGCRFSSM